MGCCDTDCPITKVCAIAGSTIVLMSRITNPSDGDELVRDDVDSISVFVSEIDGDDLVPVDDEGSEVEAGTAYDEPSVASVVQNTLQTDLRWGLDAGPDSTGWNTAYKFTPLTRGKVYDVRITFTLDGDGGTIVDVFEVTAK